MVIASAGPANSEISAPAAKIRSPPHTTTAPGGSSANDSTAAANSSSKPTDSALALGRSRRTKATPSGCRVTVMNAIRATLRAGDAVHDLLRRRPRIDRPPYHRAHQLLIARLSHRVAGGLIEQRDE